MTVVHRIVVPTSTGPRRALVVSDDGANFENGVYVFAIVDPAGGDPSPQVACGQTLGVGGGGVRLGPVGVVSVLSGAVFDFGPGTTAEDVSVTALLGLFDVWAVTTWLPLPYVFEGEGVPRDPQGAPVSSGAPDRG